MGKSAPKAPDPYKVSDAQTKSNKETAEYNAALNRIDQTSPFGSTNYTQNGVDPKTGAPLYKQSTSVSPELQRLLDSQIGAQQGISSAITGAIGRLPGQDFAPDINVDDVRKRSFDSQMAQLAPQFESGARELEGRMSDRGIPIGSEIWNDQQGEYTRAKDSSLLAASRQSDLDASNDFQRQYGNQLNEYNMPYQQLSQLMGVSSPVQNPSFNPFAQSSSQSTDVSGNVWNAYKANTDRANQQSGQLANAALGIGQMLMFSDIRLKRDIKRIGALPSGLPVYEFRYLWSDAPMVGVMAQEALHHAPDAVSRHASGFLMVDYSRIA